MCHFNICEYIVTYSWHVPFSRSRSTLFVRLYPMCLMYTLFQIFKYTLQDHTVCAHSLRSSKNEYSNIFDVRHDLHSPDERKNMCALSRYLCFSCIFFLFIFFTVTNILCLLEFRRHNKMFITIIYLNDDLFFSFEK